TGTNGKTSSARIVTSLLVATGLSVGTYTSPHLEKVTERISLSGAPIEEDVFAEMFEHLVPYVDLVEARLDEKLTYFEWLTGLFYFWAAEAPVDALVVEVGLGGRWDATNVVPAPVSIITNIGLDHTDLLGAERTLIAAEKAGIIKEGATIVTGERAPDALAVIADEAARCNASLMRLDADVQIIENQVAFGGRFLSLKSTPGSFDGLFLPLHGAHQGVNAALALEAVGAFLPAQDLSSELVAEGFAAVSAPGRMETIKQATASSSPVILDVAHNPAGISALVGALIEAFAFERVVFVVGILADKDHTGILTELSRLPAAVVFTEPRSGRARSADELAALADGLGLVTQVIQNVPEAVDAAMQLAEPGDLICITGSHYVVGEARSYLAR
ncbi:MAG: dihydrofolate synthase, partial [Actinobacteria bacterium]|nr:dihydrofolate synthase [Actinomycetota bacterium]